MRVARPVFYLLLLLTGLALAASVALWQRLGAIQEQLARQSAESGANAIEARALARQAQELARDTAARQAVADTRLNEVTQQRAQLDELMQNLSRSRDENLVVDIESALRLAQQQAQLTLSAEPLLAALATAEQRLARANQPRLARLRSAISRDMERIKATSLSDVAGLLVRLDELARQVDELPVANAVGAASAAAQARREPEPATEPWWRRLGALLREEARALVRVSRIDQPEAALLSPEQSFFLRENLKLKLLDARLSLLARQTDLARADVASAATALAKYFDPSSRRTQAAAATLQQLQAQLRNVELPRIDETLALLDAAAAGR
ncbi:uroporphyrin-III C-methyltransferase (Urogen III methylase)-like protein [Ramlibacter tataouinensis TTB310]|uniref:Uroporphyrin-III C-methyltransferase (Urogen III methylase)-like protein n=1 Tax=Ramlibacter tataouinensis (strain ATCC BAA-407 / DSM 14655 / LMG 21543 / TTB310) TaxID=365046 RepID=F5Y5T5_RAMTT|nr:uroporphyrin-III C-methyltransferase (Urogen III methylase)-like protein [Ramlibacter tataouinensis TTB310]